MKSILLACTTALTLLACTHTAGSDVSAESAAGLNVNEEQRIITGAEQTEVYFPYLRGKRVAVLANQTAVIDSIHLVDTLLASGISVKTIFAPEHGFRGNLSAGVEFEDDSLGAGSINIVSLYGSKRTPSKEDLANIDVVVFDIQDVGCRFYTYINVLRNVMYACAKHEVELLILDRPNPNGYLVDGPVLDMSLKSGIGQFPIPIAHGLTMAEFAQMINGQYWLKDSLQCRLKIIAMENYDHDMEYVLPVPPSPNLNTQQSIMLYPSTCLFEGTFLNHGRGTLFPFTVIGSPALKEQFDFSFVPKSIPGMSEAPLHMNEVCYGLDLRDYDVEQLRRSKRLNIQWIIDMYHAYPSKEDFFDSKLSRQMGNIDLLAGTREFRKQIEAGNTVEEIQASWEPELSAFKKTREAYLLYP